MTRYLPQTVLGLAFGAIFAVSCFHVGACTAAHAQPAAIADAGVPTGSAASAAPTADQLHDPIASPGAAFDDLKAAKKLGWAVLVFAVLLLLAKLAGKAKSLPLFGSKLAWLGAGKAAVVVAAVGATAAACYNAAASGGSYMAIGMAALVAIAHYLDAGKPASS